MHAFPEPFSVAWAKVILVGPQWSNKVQSEIDDDDYYYYYPDYYYYYCYYYY